MEKSELSPSCGFGSFHYQYYLDGVLIAVGVIDILPECVSSVYFYYDPEYDFLSLGTYASLREIALARELNQTCSTLKNYYLGFYIPTCPKMRYKSHMKPSYLLCPESYTWNYLDEKLSNEVDKVRYLRLNEKEEDRDKFKDEDLPYVRVLFKNTVMKYRDYRRVAKKAKNDTEEVTGYAKIVGRTLSHRIVLYRN
jgi:arginyl-tRNA---protein transferase